eukprot:TRINITY_DN21876_c0_g1_i1.p1 TRINITY_DN21876_c0_g1~~TRINITY_DN21876_c0_g1_i1.p1  ORF type:complete len:395 (+),score=153.15 TRINITY_DN21876_c0_g1_i1:188-1372(+)
MPHSDPTESLPQWAHDEKIVRWTMQGTDQDTERALRRQFSAFEDERSALIRLLRGEQEARSLAERELTEARAKIAMLEEEVSSLSDQLLEAGDSDDEEKEEDGAAAAKAAAEAAQEEVEELKFRLMDIEAENERLKRRAEKGSPSSPGVPKGFSTCSTALAQQEEMEFLRDQLTEAEEKHAEMEDKLAALESELRRLRAQTAASGEGAKQLKETQKQAEADRALVASLKRQLAKSRADCAAAQKDLQQQEDHTRNLERDLRNAAAARGASVQGHQEELQILRRKIAALEGELKDVRRPQHRDPASPEVKERAGATAGHAARQMVGKYDADYVVLFEMVFKYEQEVVRLRNEVLSLNTIISMREQDVAEQLNAEFARERNELQGRITVLEMQLQK